MLESLFALIGCLSALAVIYDLALRYMRSAQKSTEFTILVAKLDILTDKLLKLEQSGAEVQERLDKYTKELGETAFKVNNYFGGQ